MSLAHALRDAWRNIGDDTPKEDMMFGQRHSDRRRGYSLLAHTQRVIAKKGFRRAVLPLLGTAFLAAVAFANCSKNSITGPGAPAPAPGGSAPSIPQSTASSSSPKQAIAVFPTNLLPTVHPCDPTVQFTAMQGENDIDYTDEILYNSDGSPSGQHQITYNSTETQSGKDQKGNNYRHTKTTSGQSFLITNNNSKEIVSHDMITPLDASGTPQQCTTTFNFQSGQTAGGGPGCWDSGRTYEFLLTENPVTHEGTLAVTAVAIASTCPNTTLSMREP